MVLFFLTLIPLFSTRDTAIPGTWYQVLILKYLVLVPVQYQEYTQSKGGRTQPMNTSWVDYPANLTPSLFTNEYPQLLNTTYVDHAGCTTYAQSQINAYAQRLTGVTSVVGNPHSSSISASPVAYTRMKILEYFGVDSSTHSVIFNSGATAGLKTVGECFPWTTSSEFLHTTECHTSLLGIREYALAHGARVRAVPMDQLANFLMSPPSQ